VCAASYLDSSFLTVGGVKCTKQLLRAGGNTPCNIQCIAANMGWGDADGNRKNKASQSSFTERSTGEVIKPGDGSRGASVVTAPSRSTTRRRCSA